MSLQSENSPVSQNSSRPPRPNVSVEDVVEGLKSRIADLAFEFLGKPNEALSSRSQLRFGSKGSLAVEIHGPKIGEWYDHEENVGGGPLELIAYQERIPSLEAIDWARRWLGFRRAQPRRELPPTGLIPDRSHSKPSMLSDDALDALRERKIAAITSSTEEILGTPGDLYLRSRGITKDLPDCVRFRQRAFGEYGALVALATDTEGRVLAVQQTYLTDAGTKAPVPVVKRTNAAISGWAARAAVQFPGSRPIILAEGVETALSIWQATGRETWACLGISNIGNAPIPETAAVVIARDGDASDSKANRQLEKAIRALTVRGHSVSVASPPKGQDFNDVLTSQGSDAIRELIDRASLTDLSETAPPGLDIGSDVEMAHRVHKDLLDSFGPIVHTEGEFWRFCESHWESISGDELRRAVHRYDGAIFQTPAHRLARVQLGKSRVSSVLHECAALCADQKFFETRATGINCASGFISFAGDGSATLEPHDRDHRCRHTLPGRWQEGADGGPPKGSLLTQLLNGVFRGDDDATQKEALLSEVCGSAALGYATKLKQPRAVILFGQTAENGKSQILDLARGLLPPDAACSVPAARMGDERHIIGLVGKLLNATDELSAAAIASDTFKSVVTGEPVQGRDVYRSRVEFRPTAQNLFATNNLPPFQGGMDRGVQRRLLVIPFSRTIPAEERIEAIGRRIATEESDLLLAWAVAGASRLIRNRNFSIPDSCKHALDEWLFNADPVLAWLNDCTEVKPIVDHQPAIPTREAYVCFRNWAITEGFKEDKLPAINGFVQRVLANVAGVEKRRTGYTRQFEGLVVRNGGPF